MTTGSILVAVVFAALYVAFLVWYGGKGKPLSHAEVDALLAEISSATAAAGTCSRWRLRLPGQE